jgi:hypothetical protein
MDIYEHTTPKDSSTRAPNPERSQEPGKAKSKPEPHHERPKLGLTAICITAVIIGIIIVVVTNLIGTTVVPIAQNATMQETQEQIQPIFDDKIFGIAVFIPPIIAIMMIFGFIHHNTFVITTTIVVTIIMTLFLFNII